MMGIMVKKVFLSGYSTRAIVLVALVALVGGVLIETATGLATWVFRRSASVALVRQPPSSAYPLISPLIIVDVDMPEQAQEVSSFRSQVNALLDSAKRKGDITAASVFFRDFTDGRWVSINPNEQYSPASLLKIPLLISILKVAEENSGLLSKQVYYGGSPNLDDLEGVFAPSHPVIAGSYTVQELLRRMAAYSDNNAVYLLSPFVNRSVQNETYTDLGLSVPPDTTDVTTDFMTVKNYATFFRVLFSSTYLSRAYSNMALSFLSQSDFFAGIRAGVPSGMAVVNKYGERTKNGPNGAILQQELHDCGIVYYPGHPYIICVMTKASSYSGASSFIGSVSKAAYDFVNQNYAAAGA